MKLECLFEKLLIGLVEMHPLQYDVGISGQKSRDINVVEVSELFAERPLRDQFSTIRSIAKNSCLLQTNNSV